MSDELDTLIATTIAEKDAAEAVRIFNEEAINGIHPDKLSELLEVVLGNGEEESGTIYVNAIQHLAAEAQVRLNKAFAVTAEMETLIEAFNDVACEPHRDAIVGYFVDAEPDSDSTWQFIEGVHSNLSDELLTKLGRASQDSAPDNDEIAAAITNAGHLLDDAQLLAVARSMQGSDTTPDADEAAGALKVFGTSLDDAGLAAFVRKMVV